MSVNAAREPTRSRGGHLLRTLRLVLAFGAPWMSSAATARAAERVFIVTASRYEFTPSILEVEEGDRVRIALRSDDVAHGFTIAGYGVDVALPASGEAVLIDFLADRPGAFPFACSVYCGAGHRDMQGRLVVHSAPSPGQTAEPAGMEAADSRDRADSDYTLVNLPTTVTLPRHGFAFWVTHRFARPIGQGSFGDLAGDLFGLDGGAQIGLGLRFGLTSAAQLGFYRTSDRTIQLFGRHRFFEQGEAPVSFSVSGSIEGLDNFTDEYSPSVTAVVSRSLGERAGLYIAPGWVGNTNLNGADGANDDTLVLGLGARLRLTERVYVLGEISPRLAGFDGRPSGPSSAALASMGIELRYGGHLFQLNVSNDLATTPAQVARGQQGPDGWFLGFNISRKFF